MSELYEQTELTADLTAYYIADGMILVKTRYIPYCRSMKMLVELIYGLFRLQYSNTPLDSPAPQ